MVRRLLPPALLALALGCTDPVAPQYLVKDLRILAIQAEVISDGQGASDADAGDRLRLSALVANPEGLPMTVQWIACAPLLGETVSPCLDNAVLRDPARLLAHPEVIPLGTGESVETDVAPELGPAILGITQGASCPRYLELPVIAVASAGERRQMALKRVRLVAYQHLAPSGYVRNQNPRLLELRAGVADPDLCSNGTPVTGPISGRQELCGRMADGADQTFIACNSRNQSVAAVEALSWQWYVTGGTFEDLDDDGPREAGNVFGREVAFLPPEGPFTLWVIARDGRGGTSWQVYNVP
jgi:hypothetical protein